MALRRFFVHVRIERIAGEVGEVLDILQRDRAFLRIEGLSNVQILKVEAEWMPVLLDDGGALHPATGDARQHRRGALKRGALHVVMHTAHAAQFLAAAGAAGTAVHHLRHR